MKHRTVTVDLNAEPVRAPRRLAGPWWGLAGGGAFSVLAIGWIVLSGAVTLGWLGTVGIGFGTVLRLATQWLALAHGVPAELPPLAVGIATASSPDFRVWSNTRRSTCSIFPTTIGRWIRN